MVFVVSPKGTGGWLVLYGTVLGSLCPALPNLTVKRGWGWSSLLCIMEEGPRCLELGWRWAGRCSELAAQRGSRVWELPAMLGCCPKDGEAVLSLCEVVYFLLCLVPCSQLGSWPCLWDLGSGFGR